jgi:hypothetical protein
MCSCDSEYRYKRIDELEDKIEEFEDKIENLERELRYLKSCDFESIINGINIGNDVSKIWVTVPDTDNPTKTVDLQEWQALGIWGAMQKYLTFEYVNIFDEVVECPLYEKISRSSLEIKTEIILFAKTNPEKFKEYFLYITCGTPLSQPFVGPPPPPPPPPPEERIKESINDYF